MNIENSPCWNDFYSEGLKIIHHVLTLDYEWKTTFELFLGQSSSTYSRRLYFYCPGHFWPQYWWWESRTGRGIFSGSCSSRRKDQLCDLLCSHLSRSHCYSPPKAESIPLFPTAWSNICIVKIKTGTNKVHCVVRTLRWSLKLFTF